MKTKILINFQLMYQNKYTIAELEKIAPRTAEMIWQDNLYLKKFKTPQKSKFEFLDIFKDELSLTIQSLERFGEMNEDWQRIKKDLKIFESGELNVEKAKSVPVSLVLDLLGIKHKRGRCISPLVEGAKNPSAFSFKDNHYACFTSGNKGDTIDLVMKLRKISFKDSVKFINNII